jgi:Leu/Phe-tRNA-protein transferase
MHEIQLSLDYLDHHSLTDTSTLEQTIYPNMHKNYYWSNDFSPEYYIAQAKAGFISVTEEYKEVELLIPEIQYNYAILDFKNLHISKKVRRLLHQKNLKLEISSNLDDVYRAINTTHQSSWLTQKYLNTLKATNTIDPNFRVISAVIRDNHKLIAGEIGYIIAKTYTSLSGFSHKTKLYQNYGTAQLVLLAQYLEANQFDFWNLGHPYMDYKMALGAKIYERKDFLMRWKDSTKDAHQSTSMP